MITALRNSAGIRAVAAEKLGVNRSTVTRFIQRFPEIEEVEQEIVDETLDLSEGKLLQLIGQGNFNAVRFYLENKGKQRGYGIKSSSFTDPDGAPLVPAVLVAPIRETDAAEWSAKYKPE